MPKIIHYRNKCIGCGVCFELQPELWRMSKKDGKATLLHAVAKKDVFVASVTEATHARTQEIAPQCPVKIIKTQ
jgi:ferredoxin